MSRIPTPTLDTATGATAEIYAQIKKAAGKVPNTVAAINAREPAKAALEGDRVLAASALSKQDQETAKLIVSEVTGCGYCVAAHRLLGKPGEPSFYRSAPQ
jgi:alkylhydroperoxidase family enzyme